MRAGRRQIRNSAVAVVLLLSLGQAQIRPPAPPAEVPDIAEISVAEAIQALANATGKNVVFLSKASGVLRMVAADVIDLPWDEGLAACLAASGMVAVEEPGGVIRIARPDDATPAASEAPPGAAASTNVEFTEAPVKDVLRTIARVSGKNLVMSSQLKGVDELCTCVLRNVDWDDAMSAVAQTAGLVLSRQGAMIVVQTSAQLELEKRLWADLPPFKAAAEGEVRQPVAIEFRDAPALDALRTIGRVVDVQVEISDGTRARLITRSSQTGEADLEFEAWADERGHDAEVLPGIPPASLDLVTLYTRNQPWDEALIAVVRSVGLLATYDGKVVRVFEQAPGISVSAPPLEEEPSAEPEATPAPDREADTLHVAPPLEAPAAPDESQSVQSRRWSVAILALLALLLALPLFARRRRRAA